MEFYERDEVWIRNNVSRNMLSIEGVRDVTDTTLTVIRRGRNRAEGRRYLVRADGNSSFDTFWLPGAFLTRGISCMFNKEM